MTIKYFTKIAKKYGGNVESVKYQVWTDRIGSVIFSIFGVGVPAMALHSPQSWLNLLWMLPLVYGIMSYKTYDMLKHPEKYDNL